MGAVCRGRILGDALQRLLAQHLDRDELQRLLVRALQHHGRRTTGCVGLLPTHGADAPTVAGLQAAKAMFGPWRDEVVAALHLEVEKLDRHARADHVATEVAAIGASIVAVDRK